MDVSLRTPVYENVNLDSIRTVDDVVLVLKALGISLPVVVGGYGAIAPALIAQLRERGLLNGKS